MTFPLDECQVQCQQIFSTSLVETRIFKTGVRYPLDICLGVSQIRTKRCNRKYVVIFVQIIFQTLVQTTQNSTRHSIILLTLVDLFAIFPVWNTTNFQSSTFNQVCKSEVFLNTSSVFSFRLEATLGLADLGVSPTRLSCPPGRRRFPEVSNRGHKIRRRRR